MGTDEKHAATYHGGEKPPTTEDVRWWLISPEYAGGPTNEQLGKKYDRMIAQVRAEAKAEAWDEGWCVGWGNAWDTAKLTGTDLVMSDNPYKENQS